MKGEFSSCCFHLIHCIVNSDSSAFISSSWWEQRWDVSHLLASWSFDECVDTVTCFIFVKASDDCGKNFRMTGKLKLSARASSYTPLISFFQVAYDELVPSKLPRFRYSAFLSFPCTSKFDVFHLLIPLNMSLTTRQLARLSSIIIVPLLLWLQSRC